MGKAWWRLKIHTKFMFERLKGRDHLEEAGIDRRMILTWALNKQNGRMWTGFIWLRIWTNGRLL
jgi:hypothetical protein